MRTLRSVTTPAAGPPLTPLPGTGLRLDDADVPTLVAVWAGSAAAMRDLAADLDDAQWRTSTELPGWTVRDLVAHGTAIERTLLGWADPAHEPDWTSLPHVTSDFGRFTEVPVDLRRSWTRDAVLAEWDETFAARAEALADGPQGLDDEVPGPFGGTMAMRRLLRMRIFDLWAHEQDARRALDLPGGLDSPGAWVSAGQIASALPYVWGKVVGAPPGATVAVRVTGPGVLLVQTVAVGPDGRAARVADGAVAQPTVGLACSWPDLVALGCGRVGPASLRGSLDLTGDPDLGDRLLPALAITP